MCSQAEVALGSHKGCIYRYALVASFIYLFIWGFYVAFNTVQVISRRVVGRTEETST